MNQTPERLARDRVEDPPMACGWLTGANEFFNGAAGHGTLTGLIHLIYFYSPFHTRYGKNENSG